MKGRFGGGSVFRAVAVTAATGLAVVPSYVLQPFGSPGRIGVSFTLAVITLMVIAATLRSDDRRWFKIAVALLGVPGTLLWLQWGLFEVMLLTSS